MTDTANIPMDRRLTAKEAVFAIAFHDIEGGKLYDDLLDADNSDKLNEALLAAAGVIERAAEMGKVSVRGKEKVTHGSADIKSIPDYEWDGLKLEIDAIKPPAVDSVYGATVDVRGSSYRQTRYVRLSFAPEQIAELHNRHHGLGGNQSSPSENEKQSGNKGGRPRSIDWDAMYTEMVAHVWLRGLPETQAQTESLMHQWFVDNREIQPGETAMRAKISAIYRRIEEIEKEDGPKGHKPS